MKKGKFIIAGMWVALISLLWSCEQEETSANLQDESFFVNNILLGSNSAMDHVRSRGLGGPIGALYGGFTNAAGGRTSTSPTQLFRDLSRGRSDDGTNTGDSTEVNEPDCFIETWEDDGNGNYTFSLDFGDGCDYYGYYMFGKLEERGSYTDNSFSSTTTYTNFGGSYDAGGEDWSMDGTMSYSGTWEETETEEDSIWMFSSTYEFNSDLTQRYMEYSYPEDSNQVSTGEQIITMDYVDNGSEEMDHNSYTVKTRTTSITIDTGDEFHSQVNVPLFYDYTCEDTWVAVSGNESGSYIFGEESGNYIVEYGDGTCDNIITVTENGVTEDVDLGDIWTDWCGTESE